MAVIAENRRLANGIYRMRLQDAPCGLPGQFVMLRLGLDPFLNRPISIYDCEPEERALTLVYQTVGKGTEMMANMLPGQRLDVFGPFGNGFPLQPGPATLIGGGIGVAPLLLLARALRASDPARNIGVHLGFREEAFCEEDFKRYANGVHTCIGGFVTDGVAFAPGRTHYACGPAPMLQAASKKVAAQKAALYLSLEAHMACGVGACLGCRIASALGNRSVCKDGPVFPYEEVLFE